MIDTRMMKFLILGLVVAAWGLTVLVIHFTDLVWTASDQTVIAERFGHAQASAAQTRVAVAAAQSLLRNPDPLLHIVDVRLEPSLASFGDDVFTSRFSVSVILSSSMPQSALDAYTQKHIGGMPAGYGTRIQSVRIRRQEDNPEHFECLVRAEFSDTPQSHLRSALEQKRLQQ